MSAEIPEIGFKERLTTYRLGLRIQEPFNSDLEIHKSTYQTRSGLEIYKVGDKFIVVSRYAPVKLEAYIVIVCDEAKAKEHERYDLHAEHNWEREQDMLADAREAEYDDRDRRPDGLVLMAFDIQTATDDELNNEITTLVHAWCYGAKRARPCETVSLLTGVSLHTSPS